MGQCVTYFFALKRDRASYHSAHEQLFYVLKKDKQNWSAGQCNEARKVVFIERDGLILVRSNQKPLEIPHRVERVEVANGEEVVVNILLPLVPKRRQDYTLPKKRIVECHRRLASIGVAGEVISYDAQAVIPVTLKSNSKQPSTKSYSSKPLGFKQNAHSSGLHSFLLVARGRVVDADRFIDGYCHGTGQRRTYGFGMVNFKRVG